LTETGCGNLKENDWFTSRILNPIKSDTLASKIAYLVPANTPLVH
jgi:hypothetical protein